MSDQWILGRLRAGAQCQEGKHYAISFWSLRNVVGPAFVSDLEGRGFGWTIEGGVGGMSVAPNRPAGYNHGFVVRAGQTWSLASLQGNVAGAVVRVSGCAIEPDWVRVYDVAEAAWARTRGLFSPIYQAAQDVSDVSEALDNAAGQMASDARDASRTIGHTVADFAAAMKWIAIGIPLTAAIVVGGYFAWKAIKK